MADGDRPFMVMSRVLLGVEFRIDQLEELMEMPGTGHGPGLPLPYPAWLCSPFIYEITVVTPDDPDIHPFSAWGLAMVRKACREE